MNDALASGKPVRLECISALPILHFGQTVVYDCRRLTRKYKLHGQVSFIFFFLPNRDGKWMNSVKDLNFFKCYFQIRDLSQSLDTLCLQ